MKTNSNFEDSYVETKSRLIKLSVEASKNLTTFALLEEIVDLQGQFCYTEAELQRYNSYILVLKCQLLHKKLSEHTSDLMDYGINERKLSQLEQAIDDFKTVSRQQTASSHEFIPENSIIR